MSTPTTEQNSTFKAKLFDFFGNINPLVVIFFLCTGLAVLTFIIPGGNFERQTVELLGSERQIVVPNSFKFADSVPQGLAELWTIFMRGAIEGADRAFVIFLASGSMTAIIATGAVHAGIRMVISRFSKYQLAFIPILVFSIGFCGASFGMWEEVIPFILVIRPIFSAMGYNPMLGVFVVYWSVVIGFASGFTNPYNVGIGQAIAGVPLYSGMGFRIFCFVVLMTVTSIAIIRQVKIMQKEDSLQAADNTSEEILVEVEDSEMIDEANQPMTPRRALVLLSILASIGILMYGIITYEWSFVEIGSLFFWMGIVIPLIGGMSVSETIDKIIEGMRSVMIAVIMLSAAQCIYYILHDANILDTILFYISELFQGVNPIIIAYSMFGAKSLVVGIIGSASGTAASVMPILAPLAEVLNFPKQVVVLGFQFATGTFNFWLPWDGIAFTLCSMAGVNFYKYLKKSAQFSLCWYVPTVLVLLTIAIVTGYN